MIRLYANGGWRWFSDRHALAEVERGLAGFLTAIEDGLYLPAMKAWMTHLDAEGVRLRARIRVASTMADAHAQRAVHGRQHDPLNEAANNLLRLCAAGRAANAPRLATSVRPCRRATYSPITSYRNTPRSYVFNVLGLLVDLEPRQRGVLERIVDGPLVPAG
ncbi:hypothetical protein SAMN05216557_1069 [Sphingomonas carotinifaciens]|uniref:Uncharacterized protein n=1 Tax=Sphingomonas carotinifaciens TaxID=1166323 RepID=A0A1G7P284_9SPHN|nr:hypothetical protein [Sphingomonas carotinifaciens]SDF79540.1 hypothetical protein SAMN05216557_1069 [Sphingomonas carotinifaciens]